MRAAQIAVLVLAAGAGATSVAAAAVDQPSALIWPDAVVSTPPPPPPVVVRQGRMAGQVEDTRLRLPEAETTCNGVAISPVYSEALAAQQASAWDARDDDTVLSFSIAADGRTTDISPDDAPRTSFGALQAELAAWRFPAQPRQNCRLTVRWRVTPLAEAETPDLLNYFAVNRTTGPLRNAVAKRLGGPDADCGARFGGRRPEVVSFPNFQKGRRPPPGGRSWSVTRWNIDAEGRATNVETLGSSGDADLDAEARRATAETRMLPGPARTGCVYNVYRTGETLPAPPMPPEDQPEDPLQQCPPAVGDRFKARSNPAFPAAFSQRSIEGWAKVRFDIAPWGQIGNVSVIEAQPAAAFGEDALRLVQTSQATPGFEAGVRCVVPVRYRLPDEDAASQADQD